MRSFFFLSINFILFFFETIKRLHKSLQHLRHGIGFDMKSRWKFSPRLIFSSSSLSLFAHYSHFHPKKEETYTDTRPTEMLLLLVLLCTHFFFHNSRLLVSYTVFLASPRIFTFSSQHRAIVVDVWITNTIVHGLSSNILLLPSVQTETTDEFWTWLRRKGIAVFN